MRRDHTDDRIPLPDGTKLTDKLTVTRLLSNCGGSSLTYLAKNPNGRTYVVKETFPYRERESGKVSFVRKGYAVLPEDGRTEEEIQKAIEEIECDFKKECENSNNVCYDGDKNGLFHFSCTDITEEVRKTKGFSETVAYYMAIDTLSGRTLREICEQDVALSLRQALLYTLKILVSLKSMHSGEKPILHLDIKTDNIFFPDELSAEETFAIILDIGSALCVGDVASAGRFSISDGFSAREIQLFKEYSSGLLSFSSDGIERYRRFIGTQTDLYSVGAIAYRLISGKEFSFDSWNDLDKSDDPKKRKALIFEQMNKVLSEKYPYLVKKVSEMLYKALYFSTSGIEYRYKECDAFIDDIETLTEIIDCKGVHPEVAAECSRRKCEELLSSEDHFVEKWLPSVCEEK